MHVALGKVLVPPEPPEAPETSKTPKLLSRLAPGKYVQLVVTDQGPGVPPAVRERLFDPFFTTKPSGTGLGLPICASIVQKHDGAIFLDAPEAPRSQENAPLKKVAPQGPNAEPNPEAFRGARFVVYLPALAADSVDSSPALEQAKRFTGRVLVMDDLPAIQATLKTMLVSLGFAVDVASDGREAVARFQAELDRTGSSRPPYDLVILDLTVPGGMGGKDALAALLALAPGTRAIMTSGYTELASVEEYRQWGFQGFLKKPYTRQELARVLQGLELPAPAAAP